MINRLDSPTTDFLRLELPRFDGTHASGWIFRVQGYFDYHGTLKEQCLRVVAFNTEGKALDWYRLIKANNMLSLWVEFSNVGASDPDLHNLKIFGTNYQN